MNTDADHTYWSATADDQPEFPPLAGDLETDVVIVGGGIVGITTARCLKDLGVRVVVLEARRAGRQVTGKSTAKVSSQHGLKYRTLEKKFGHEHARRYGEAQELAIRKIREFAAQHQIECDLEDKAAYVYTRDKGSVSMLKDEFEAAQRFGLPAQVV